MHEYQNGHDDVADLHRNLQDQEETGKEEKPESPKPMSGRLVVGGADDPSESEADAIAKKVVGGEKVSMHNLTASKNPVLAKHENQEGEESKSLSMDLAGTKGSGKSLDDTTRHEMESGMGTDLSDVKIHVGAAANELSESIHAKAFAHGQDIYFKDGNYNPGTASGKELLAHELVHTKQPAGNDLVRRTVIETDAVFKKTFDEFRAMTLDQLDDFAQKQVDWYNNEAFSATNDPDGKKRGAIRKVLAFARKPDYLRPVGGITVGDILDHISAESKEGAVFAEVEEYVKAFNSKELYRPYIQRTVDDAINAGKKFLKFQAEFKIMPEAETVLFTNTKVNKQEEKREIFEALKSPADIDDLIQYIRSTPTPYFQTAADFMAFAKLNEQKKVKDYQSSNLKGYIRNFHRFEKEALDNLILHFSDTSKTKRLVLILHTSTDWNGALVANPHLTEAIRTNNANEKGKDRQILPLLLEGAANLSEYTKIIPGLVKTYGKDDRIDQVVIIGHGSDHSVELGGSVTVERPMNDPIYKMQIMQQSTGTVDFKENKEETKDLFDTILGCMKTDGVKDPKDLELKSRIVFYACLTNTEDVPGGRTLKKTNFSRTLISGWLRRHKNLIDRVKDEVGDDPAAYNIDKVIGSLASHSPRVKLLNADNTMGLNPDERDPGISSEDPLEFVKVGLEAEGLTNAVLKCWAGIAKGTKYSDSKLFLAMQTRAGEPATGWKSAWIKSAFTILTSSEANFGNAQLIDELGHVVKALHGMESEAKYSRLKLKELEDSIKISKPIFKELLLGLKQSSYWTSSGHYYALQTLMYLMIDDKSVVTDILAIADIPEVHYGDIGNQFFDFDAMKKDFNSSGLLPVTKTKGSLLFAVAGVKKLHDATARTSCINYLSTEGSNPELAAILEFVYGSKIERNKFRKSIGLAEEVVTDQDKVTDFNVQEDVGNLALFENVEKGGTVKNTLHVTSVTLTKYGNNTKVYLRPEESAVVDKASIPIDQEIFVSGKSNDGKIDWYVIEYFYEKEKKNGTAFVKKGDVKDTK